MTTRDYQHLLFQTNFQRIWRNSGDADYYLYSLKDKTMKSIVKGAFTAEVSPDGTKVGYGKNGDLFVFELASGKHSQLTHDGKDKYYNGRFGWANEEEFGLVQAWEWSWDSRYIAFWQSDEREVPLYRLTDFSGQHPEYLEIPYPKVGDTPPVEKLGILNVQDGIKAIDSKKKTLYYLSTEVSPLERNLYSVKFNGKGKQQITSAPGNHRVNVSPSGQYFIDSYSDTNTPSQVDLRDRNGELLIVLAGQQQVASHLEEYEYAGKELFSFTTSDGQKIDGYLIRPMDFDPGKSYPLLMDVYGGPGSQGVYNTFETSDWHQYLAQRGYVIANINNRHPWGCL